MDVFEVKKLKLAFDPLLLAQVLLVCHAKSRDSVGKVFGYLRGRNLSDRDQCGEHEDRQCLRRLRRRVSRSCGNQWQGRCHFFVLIYQKIESMMGSSIRAFQKLCGLQVCRYSGYARISRCSVYRFLMVSQLAYSWG